MKKKLIAAAVAAVIGFSCSVNGFALENGANDEETVVIENTAADTQRLISEKPKNEEIKAMGGSTDGEAYAVEGGNIYIKDNVVVGCDDSVTSAVIPDGVTSLGWRCFSGCSSLTSVAIPENVTSLGWLCFSGCSSLTSVAIPEGVTSLGWNCFSGCSSLTSVAIPENVTSIEESCFSGCSS
ncbi:MAG: leucine-rich repeat domain-containing protein, partial [Firmicutes bacterium]|nr:leucine-rich repeat domain-containing protein [Bacillota bacterium]